MSQNIWRPVDYEFLNSQPDINLEEDQMEDIVVILMKIPKTIPKCL